MGQTELSHNRFLNSFIGPLEVIKGEQHLIMNFEKSTLNIFSSLSKVGFYPRKCKTNGSIMVDCDLLKSQDH